jgi:transposase-like protein
MFSYITDIPYENACIEHFKAQREQNDVVCPKCGSKEHYWLKGKLRYECKDCHYRQSLRSGTAMEHSKLPLMGSATSLIAATKANENTKPDKTAIVLRNTFYRVVRQTVRSVNMVEDKTPFRSPHHSKTNH